VYLIFTFREFKSIHKGKTAILHLRFGTEKNRRLGSKKARLHRAFRRRHLFCLHIMVEPRRIELLSENRSANLSTRLVKSFEIPFLLSGSQDRSPVVLWCVDGYRTLTENIAVSRRPL